MLRTFFTPNNKRVLSNPQLMKCFDLKGNLVLFVLDEIMIYGFLILLLSYLHIKKP